MRLTDARRWWFTVVVVLAAPACRSSSTTATPDPACAESFRAWLAALDAEGHVDSCCWHAELAKLDHPPTRKPVGQTIDVEGPPRDADGLAPIGTAEDRGRTLFSVRLGSEHIETTSFPDRAAARLAEALRRPSPADPSAEPLPLLITFDREIPWEWVRPLLEATRATRRPIVLGFIATGPSRTPTPPPSSIDAELAAWDEQAAAKGPPSLDLPAPGPRVAAVYRRCPAAIELFRRPHEDHESAHSRLMQLPDAVAACGCNVEIPAVQRLMWRLYGRHEPAQAWIELGLDHTGPLFQAAPGARWSDVAPLLHAATRGGGVRLL